MCKNNSIDNSSLIPVIKPDNEVGLDANGTPDWATGLIFAQIRVRTATPEGTLEAAVRVLDHYAEMGVNAIWVSPVFDPGTEGNGYSNLGVHTVDPHISGRENYEEGWLKVADFVKEAHKRNIRILLDIISWGAIKDCKFFADHPEWSNGPAEWEGDAYNWSNEEFKEWYIQNAVNIVMTTDCDGLRYDVEPRYAGYDVCKEIRDRLHKLGKKPFMMSEAPSERRNTYDCEQIGITGSTLGYFPEKPIWYFLERFNIVDSIKLGVNIGIDTWKYNPNYGCTDRFYVNTVTCHDHRFPVVIGNRLAIGYQAIYAPFIPQWYIGEEWNNPHNIIPGNGGPVLYFNEINWSALEEPKNKEFFEDVKKMIRVRRENPEIFEYYPEHFKDTNICKVEAEGTMVQAYARYSSDTALIIVPNFTDNSCDITVTVPFEEMVFDSNLNYKITDAVSGEKIDCFKFDNTLKITVKVNAMDQRVIKLSIK